MSKLPLKLRVFDYIAHTDHPVTTDEVVEALAPEYKGEMQMKFSRIDFYLQSLLGVNMIKQDKVEFDNSGNVQVYYVITDFGRSRIKYIPKNKENSSRDSI